MVALFEPIRAEQQMSCGYAVEATDGINRPCRFLDWARDVPHYSTDIAAAHEAAEKMRERWDENDCKYRFRFHQLDGGKWSVDIIWPVSRHSSHL